MNTNQMHNRKMALANALKNGKPFRYAVAPGELLALIAHSDPLDFGRGTELLLKQTKANESDFYEYQFDNRCYESALEVARNTYYMDPVRAEVNKFKYENGLLADDEVLALALFFLADSDAVINCADYGEAEFDDFANLVNHVANRMKFLLLCMRDGRYDILNTVIQFARAKKTSDIDSIFCLDTVEPDDGGTIDYFKAMIDHEAYANYCLKEHEKEPTRKTQRKVSFSDDDSDTDSDDDFYGDDDYDDDTGEPIVERDFEG